MVKQKKLRKGIKPLYEELKKGWLIQYTSYEYLVPMENCQLELTGFSPSNRSNTVVEKIHLKFYTLFLKSKAINPNGIPWTVNVDGRYPLHLNYRLMYGFNLTNGIRCIEDRLYI